MTAKSKKTTTKETAQKKAMKVKSEGAAAGPKSPCCAGGIGSIRR